ncbi:MAG: anion permease [Sphingomonas bacterium]|nr:anion permease [Sphingomonas bacterium]
MLIALLIPLALAATVYALILLRAAIIRRVLPLPEAIALGAITNFFDTLGIGSFAPTMVWIKFRKLVPDRLIPCTMLAGHALPSMAQAVVFLVLLGVYLDPVLLVGCVLALLMGALMGAPLAARALAWIVQLVVGFALLLAAAFYARANLHLMPGGGTAASLSLPLLIVAIAANFLFGILLNFGVGNYAPTLAMLSLMGMDPRLSFPIMAGGAALAGSAASTRHVLIGKIDLRIATGLAIGGIPAVLFAAFIVRSMPIELLRWLVIFVVVYAAAVMLRSAFVNRRQAPLEFGL